MTIEEAFERAKAAHGTGAYDDATLEFIFPELAESEDERIRKALIWHLKADMNFVSNGVTKAECLAYLEKQKEQKPLSPFDELTPEEKMNHPLYLEGFDVGRDVQKVFDEQKPAEWSDDSVKFKEGFKAGRESGLLDGQKYVLNNLDSYGLCKLEQSGWRGRRKNK